MTGAYSKKLEEWDQQEANETKSDSSIISAIFGSCTGVIDAASVIFAAPEPGKEGEKPDEEQLQPKPKRSRSKSPSLQKSGEVLEIPEFLSADIIDGHVGGNPAHDDLSAISSFTLEEMARQKLLLRKNKQSRKRQDQKMISKTTRDDEELKTPGQKYMPGKYIPTAPLSGMLVAPHANKMIFSSHDGGSVSSLGSSSFRQTYPLIT
mmetsp:Transcript_10583/g.15584  ORF Transcript_10583/g.15584 Transcript_10583/m.15584 type:complete len:207 (+) Transcript_10583:196-816(+)|eukprot:CAMPEP_0194208066 /NCGR_PEP_ID=MMETSP0156-20130528/6623_1 /TAXON_ID=33649 /ORGANISM="Thalassionema nitzschioides, Strain L26-B" /LENGTH=206 /DNA_ID=CAMNT_0038934951 /DNA_START=185 /DNA_END=805 /DNA_ORIENTATION=-